MDIVVSLGLVLLLVVFEPGNKELNETCRQEVAAGKHESMIQCREWYRPKKR